MTDENKQDDGKTTKGAEKPSNWEDVKEVVNAMVIMGLLAQEDESEPASVDPFKNVQTFEDVKYFLEMAYSNREDRDPRAGLARDQVIHRFIIYSKSPLYDEKEIERTWKYLKELCLRDERGSADLLASLFNKDKEGSIKRIGEIFGVVLDDIDDVSKEKKEQAALIAQFMFTYTSTSVLKSRENFRINDIHNEIFKKYDWFIERGMKKEEILESTLLGILINGLSESNEKLVKLYSREENNSGDQAFIKTAKKKYFDIQKKLADRELI